MSTSQGSTAAGSNPDATPDASSDAEGAAGRPATGGGRPHRAGAFDIRTFIGSLIGAYGVVLVLMGLFSTSDSDLERAGGINVNLWAGLGMVAVAAVLLVWARVRPVIVPDDASSDTEGADRQPPSSSPGGSPDTR